MCRSSLSRPCLFQHDRSRISGRRRYRTRTREVPRTTTSSGRGFHEQEFHLPLNTTTSTVPYLSLPGRRQYTGRRELFQTPGKITRGLLEAFLVTETIDPSTHLDALDLRKTLLLNTESITPLVPCRTGLEVLDDCVVLHSFGLLSPRGSIQTLTNSCPHPFLFYLITLYYRFYGNTKTLYRRGNLNS